MSAAFDRIKRNVLIEDLQEILNPDELHIVSLLLKHVQIAIKIQNEIGPFFDFVIGSPQGDSASAIFFITYLARSKRVHPNLLFDHLNKLVFLLDQQYSDDVSFAATSKSALNDIKHETINSLKERNLKVNESKTEEFSVKPNGNDDWKKCKLVGSLLDTTEDIKRRTSLANTAYCNIKPILLSKRISTNIKIRVFKALIESIYLCNSEVWGLTTTQENAIDVFQRKFLRNILGIRYSAHNWISNDELYRITKQEPWSNTIRKRRLQFFGHVCRLHELTPARIALNEALRPVKRPKGGKRTTYIGTITKDLKKLHLSIDQATQLSANREVWRDLLRRA